MNHWVHNLLLVSILTFKFANAFGNVDEAEIQFFPPPGACGPDTVPCWADPRFKVCCPRETMYCANRSIYLCCERNQIASGGICCPQNHTRCGDICCASTCSNGVCCPKGQFGVEGICCPNVTDFNCDGTCCSGTCLSGICCPPGYYLSNGVCCPPTEVCCPPGLELLDGLCCKRGARLCNGQCCDGFCAVIFVPQFPPGGGVQVRAHCFPIFDLQEHTTFDSEGRLFEGGED